MLTRLRSDEAGFGLIELILALTMLNVGILATVAALNSGAVALQRANKVSTASALADAQMETYRGLRWESITLLQSLTGATDSTYANDVINGDRTQLCRTDGTSFVLCADPTPDASDPTAATVCAGTPTPDRCNPSRTVSGASSPDGRAYRIDTYIQFSSAGTSRPLKVVTVVVRDGTNLAKALIRAQSTFDESTGV